MRSIQILCIILFTSCNSMRKIDVCLIQGTIAECAKGDKKYQLQYPSEMGKWQCWNLQAQVLLGEKLTLCEQDGRLDRNDNTWDDMNVCEIQTNKDVVPCEPTMDSFFCTDPSGAQKITSRLDWCSSR